jgi:hypothetical protein
MSTLKVSTIRSNTASTPPTIADTNGVEVGQLCRGWIFFNGTGTPAAYDDFNVSSIVDNGTGDYTINWENALPSANYAAFVAAGSTSTNTGTTRDGTTLRTASLIRILTFEASAGTATDFAYVSVCAFGD